MMIVPISWSFQRKSMLPIIEAKAESTVEKSETILVQNALKMIKKADEFKGRPYPNMPSFPTTTNFSVSFSLIFPTETDINSFMEFLKNNN